jgi:putative intracellular protease/amidase
MSKRVLMIVTSNAVMGATGKATGIWAEELAVPYFVFTDFGLSVEIASPQGGTVPFDPASIQPKGRNGAEVERFLADAEAQSKFMTTHAIATVDVTKFDAVFFPGGHGTMWDLPNDAHVAKAVEAAHAAGKVIGAVCHGVAGLVSAKDKEGKSILSGKRVNSFTNEEEIAVGLDKVMPFMLESRIRELGGDFEKAANWQAFAVRDGNLVTGQNPSSSGLVAQYVLQALADVRTSLAA